MTNILHYDAITEFRKQFYKDLLTLQNLVGSQVKIDKLHYPDGSIQEDANFWGYVLEKDNIKYLLPSKDTDGKEIDIRNVLPLRAKTTLKVATKGQAYQWIRQSATARFRSEKRMSFRQLIQKLASLGHTNKEHQTLMWFIGMASMMDRFNCRISTPAGFGKDSVVDIVGNLIGGANTIENPSIAKLEFETAKTWLMVNEAVGVRKADWEMIEQFLLATGAKKTEVTKRTRSGSSGVPELLDISNFSLGIAYNDIDHYIDMDRYFDFVTKEAVKDRFPPFRLYGRYKEDFGSIRSINVKTFAEQHKNEYLDIIYTYHYYKDNVYTEMHRWSLDKLPQLSPRWEENIKVLLKYVDLYCETQEEFDYWITVIINTIEDYKEMLRYPSLFKTLSTKKTREYTDPVSGLVSKEYQDYMNKLKVKLASIPLFGQKNNLLVEEMRDNSKTVSYQDFQLTDVI